MTFQTYLKINGKALPVQKDDYSVDYSDVVADSGLDFLAIALHGVFSFRLSVWWWACVPC
jgi:hypothetical protein